MRAASACGEGTVARTRSITDADDQHVEHGADPGPLAQRDPQHQHREAGDDRPRPDAEPDLAREALVQHVPRVEAQAREQQHRRADAEEHGGPRAAGRRDARAARGTPRQFADEPSGVSPMLTPAAPRPLAARTRRARHGSVLDAAGSGPWRRGCSGSGRCPFEPLPNEKLQPKPCSRERPCGAGGWLRRAASRGMAECRGSRARWCRRDHHGARPAETQPVIVELAQWPGRAVEAAPAPGPARRQLPASCRATRGD